jgi:hypothetical protein
MDYERIYNQLIQYRKTNPILSGYKENHHIIPSSLGGSDDKTNKVALTGREHYIAHLLLARFNRCAENAHAIWAMQMKPSKNSDRPCIKSGRMYEWARKECAKYISRNNKITQKGERNSQFGKHWISNIDLKESRCIDKTLPIPEGWIKGRNKWIVFKRKPRPSRAKNLRPRQNKKQIARELRRETLKSRKETNQLLAKSYWIQFNNGSYSSLCDFARNILIPEYKIRRLFVEYILEYLPIKGVPFKSKLYKSHYMDVDLVKN